MTAATAATAEATTKTATAALAPADFIEQLQVTLKAHYHHRHPFNVRMHEGTLTRTEIQVWVLNRFHYQQCIPVKDALVLAKLPGAAERRRWIQRIIDHDGHDDQDGGIEAWIRLGEATGLTRAAFADPASVTPAARFVVDGYVSFCRERPWVEAVASSLTELFAPRLIGQRLDILRTKYSWIEPDGLDYFIRRLHQAPRDADHALELVMAYATTAEAQAGAIAALRFKCDVLWSLLDAVEMVTAKGLHDPR